MKNMNALSSILALGGTSLLELGLENAIWATPGHPVRYLQAYSFDQLQLTTTFGLRRVRLLKHNNFIIFQVF